MIHPPRDIRIAVTGANGFVGAHLVKRLLADGCQVRGLVRRPLDAHIPGFDLRQVKWDGPSTDWSAALRGVDIVVHLAARTHAIHERGHGDLDEYRRVNVEGTQSLAMAAVRGGVRRFIFLSSIKVNGERTTSGPFCATDSPSPEDSYGISKWEAEQVLGRIACSTGMETVIIRPPLVYGPGVKGNFARLCHFIRRGFVLPFGAINNRRSLVGVENLVDLVRCCVSHEDAPGRTFLVSDGEDLSTPQLIHAIADAMGIKARLIAVPRSWLRIAGNITGRWAEVARLLDSLQIDIEPTRRVLNWSPPTSLSEGLKATLAPGKID